MALPLKYNFRNLLVRWRATLATVLGIALVVAVYVVMQSMAEGIRQSGKATGSKENILIVRKGSTSESSSLVTREQFNSLQYSPEILRDTNGLPLISADVLVLINLPRQGTNSGEANLLLRGVTRQGMALRAQVNLVGGRWFTPGKREVVVSTRLAKRFADVQIGETFKTGRNRFTVVGHFDGGGSAFDSECWMDADECRAAFDRDMYSSLLIRPIDALAATNLIRRVESDKRLQLRAIPEADYYATQTKTAEPIKWMGNILATAMSIGAIFAAMNTMYASIGSRTREIGTMRALGFRRRTLVISFLIEGALLAAIGGVIGVLASLKMNGYTTGTISFETFSETVFQFRITPALMLKGLIFSIIVGLLGTLLPAIRASRIPVIAALKSL